MKIKERKISEKQIKIIAVITIVVIVVGILLWGMIPREIYDVSEILEKSENFDDKEVNVIGIVRKWNYSFYNFTLMDSKDENFVINITHIGVIPEGFGNNETVIVKGIFHLEEGYIESQSIQIGCPSKY